MKFINKNINAFLISLIVLFVVVSGFSVVELMGNPERILKSIGIIEISKINIAKEASMPVYLLLGANLFLVLLLLFSFSLKAFHNAKENIIYVEKERKDEDFDSTIGQDQGSVFTERLHRFKSILHSSEERLNYKGALSEICKELDASMGALYLSTEEDGIRYIELEAGYAYQVPESKKLRYEYGEGIAGQVAGSGKDIVLDSVPDGYISIISGLGNATPNNLAILPIKLKEHVKGVLEIASFSEFKNGDIDFLKQAIELFLEEEELSEVEVDN
ncbi:GAF domain-containing protein [Flexithrix dorotheae]|uniref:GAF domain-containing protein n=1 Tax=Flexithrix dorotheae TaxID=70993 RepID=UPI0003658DE1|nr:GAF domain-containing protein [Flexithrix dorotheae]